MIWVFLGMLGKYGIVRIDVDFRGLCESLGNVVVIGVMSIMGIICCDALKL